MNEQEDVMPRKIEILIHSQRETCDGCEHYREVALPMTNVERTCDLFGQLRMGSDFKVLRLTSCLLADRGIVA